MTRRERLEAKLAKRAEWADKRDARASAACDKAHRIASVIPPGQPILVGHHSERHHRRDIGRMDSAMRESVESTKMAEHHRSKAAGLEVMLETAIFSDDPDAVEAIEAKIAKLEAERAAMKASNAAFRKGDEAWAKLLGITLEQAAARRKTIMEGYSWCRQPHPAFELSNLAGNLGRMKKRLVTVKARQATTAKAEAAPNGILIDGSADYARVTFAEKPSREILNDLKAAGFHWSGGSWCGVRRNLPSTVAALAAPPAKAVGPSGFGTADFCDTTLNPNRGSDFS